MNTKRTNKLKHMYKQKTEQIKQAFGAFLKKYNKLMLVSGGLLAGLLNGLLGTGGGILAVPTLRAGGLEQKESLATGSAVIWTLCLTSLLFALLAGDAINWGQIGMLTIGGLPGALIGASLLSRLNGRWLQLAFDALLVYSGVRLLCG